MNLFSKETLDFLFENRLNDSKEWFEEHKDRFQTTVFAPLHDLAERLAPTMLKIDPEFTTEPKTDKTICRVRRDTRFSNDKSLYRDNMWIIFKRGKMHGTEVPGIYFELSQHGFEYGCGFYHASTAFMSALRRRVLENDPLFTKAQRFLEHQSLYQVIGDCYKRAHYPDHPDSLRQWLERREICVTAQSKDYPLLFSDRLLPKLEQDLLNLKPVYQLFLKTSQDLNRKD